MNTFPTLTASPDIQGWTDEYSSEAVEIASFASGYPCINAQFTFDPRTWSHTLSNVSQTDKNAIMVFYQANKDVPFYWSNTQDSTTYEVVFVQKPSCQTQDNDNKTLWQIGLVLRQSAATELPAASLTNRYYGADAMINVINLAVAEDISNLPVYVAADGVTITGCRLLTQGTPAGIDNSNTVVLTLTVSGNTLLTKTYNTGTQPPTNDEEDLTSLLDSDYVALSAGDVIKLSVTQGTTANMPAFLIVFSAYYT